MITRCGFHNLTLIFPSGLALLLLLLGALILVVTVLPIVVVHLAVDVHLLRPAAVVVAITLHVRTIDAIATMIDVIETVREVQMIGIAK